MILVCDIGTSSLKAGIIDDSGKLVCFKKVAVASFAPAFRADDWTKAFMKAARAFPSGARRKLRAIGISGQGPTLVPLDRRDQPFKPLFWFDGNGTAGTASTSYFLPLVNAFRKNDPVAFDNSRVFLPCPEFLCFRLTGEKVANIPHAGFVPYYWSVADIQALGFETWIFPPLKNSADPVAGLSARSAAGAGIPARIPVFCTGPDFLAAALGAAAHLPGRANLRGGTSETLNLVCDSPEIERRKHLPGSLPESVRVVPGFSADTANISLFHRNIGRLHALLAGELFSGRRRLDGFCEAAFTALPGSDGLKFVPPANPGVRMTSISLTECFSDAAGNRGGRIFTRENLARAFLEYAAAGISGSCRELSAFGLEVKELRVSGGLSKCEAYNRIKARTTGLPVVVPLVRDAELLGNAAVAMAGLGDYADPQEASSALFRAETVIMPND